MIIQMCGFCFIWIKPNANVTDTMGVVCEQISKRVPNKILIGIVINGLGDEYDLCSPPFST